jgi:hypothetical protein
MSATPKSHKRVQVLNCLLRFFRQKNNDPVALMEAATWWIATHQLDHFAKTSKIKKWLKRNSDCSNRTMLHPRSGDTVKHHSLL